MIVSKKTLSTILARAAALLINFLLVVFTARVWGSEGRGLIALIMADVAIIVILNNVFSGATVAYHTPRAGGKSLFVVAWGGALLTSLGGALVFSLIQGFQYFFLLAGIALLNSLAASISFFWLGKNNIRLYNLMMILPPLLLILFLLAGYYGAGITRLRIYFISWFLAYATVWGLGMLTLRREGAPPREPGGKLLKSMASYGMKSELSYFLQFLNYRLAYFLISSWLGLKELGLFSVAVAVSEAVWIIGKSISALLYADVLNSPDPRERIRMTTRAVRTSFLLTFPALALLILIPEKVYLAVFGADFAGMRLLVLYLAPGILAVAVANVIGHYFSATGRMNLLIIKSSVGLGITALFLVFFLKKYGLPAACFTLDAAYLAILLYLGTRFIREMRRTKD